MTRREVLIARSVVYAILTTLPNGQPARQPSLLARALRIFRLFSLTFRLLRPDLFRALRGVWEIPEGDYRASFGAEGTTNEDSGGRGGGRKQRNGKGKGKGRQKDVLLRMGDMGYSGSTFFRTRDGAYVVKSVPRRFEHEFFKDELLLPYAEHMRQNPDSLLIRIADMLERTHKSIGELLGLAPSHHIVMENILHGQDRAPGGGAGRKWETWDLKPTSFFYPERDVAGGMLATQATKSKLADEFDGKLKLSKAHAVQLREILEKDTQLLADNNTVDYSLFLVRISGVNGTDPGSQPPIDPRQEVDEPILCEGPSPPPSSPDTPSWRTGIPSSDGKEVYRAAILDFFWAKHTLHAKVMTGLVRGYNLIDEQGPMSITAESHEYRERFLEMCAGYVEAEE
ncbi:putative phosphatidylinositol-4-phosphate 5-kinase core protein [Rosellinia necatrix]|uniref:Putative phosphatidylinositol-4-phosphate 5-kinase core protein n=1 Tax=Rosellinia necatrix TaxID=77044 RepID=A0A1S7UPS6_ROSNE|nr:putative phosphatidylinositol-4-phosphate 5-kinase core protein [Rosellinia necatrix]